MQGNPDGSRPLNASTNSGNDKGSRPLNASTNGGNGNGSRPLNASTNSENGNGSRPLNASTNSENGNGSRPLNASTSGGNCNGSRPLNASTNGGNTSTNGGNASTNGGNGNCSRPLNASTNSENGNGSRPLNASTNGGNTSTNGGNTSTNGGNASMNGGNGNCSRPLNASTNLKASKNRGNGRSRGNSNDGTIKGGKGKGSSNGTIKGGNGRGSSNGTINGGNGRGNSNGTINGGNGTGSNNGMINTSPGVYLPQSNPQLPNIYQSIIDNCIRLLQSLSNLYSFPLGNPNSQPQQNLNFHHQQIPHQFGSANNLQSGALASSSLKRKRQEEVVQETDLVVKETPKSNFAFGESSSNSCVCGKRREGPAIGIDLGTSKTYSCVHDRVEIIPNDQGNRTTPYVAFTDSERKIGDAKNQVAMNPTNTVFDAKRGDPSVQADMRLKAIHSLSHAPSISQEGGNRSSKDTESKSGPDNEFENGLRSQVIAADEIGVKFADIGSLDETKESLQELVSLPLRRPDLFQGGLLKPCKGVLLFGPPGTGKTMLAKAIANEAGASFITISMATITGKWFGNSEKNVKALFTLAAKVSPTVIFVDEVDGILGKRKSYGESDSMRNIKNEFMTHWDGLMTKPSERIIVLAATNRPFDLDEAVIRRFERRIMVGLPSIESREKIFRTLLSKEKTDNLDFHELGQMTEGYTGCDLKNLCITAAYRPLRELIEQEKLRDQEKKKEEEAKKSTEDAKKSQQEPKEEAGKSTEEPRKGKSTEEKEEESSEERVTKLRPLNMEDMRMAKNQIAASFESEGAGMQELKKWNELYGEGGSRKQEQLTYFI